MIKNTLFVLVSLVIFAFNIPENGKIIKDFRLMNVDGKEVSLSDYPDAKGFVIVFTCNHCPFAKLYPKRMNELNSKYKASGFPLIAISSTDTVTFEEDAFLKMAEKSNNGHFNFPYLFDADQKVARSFNAQKTPHAFVILREGKEFSVKYNGAIDDNAAEPEKAQHKYVEDAVKALLSGKEVEIKETKSIGCQIHYRN